MQKPLASCVVLVALASIAALGFASVASAQGVDEPTAAEPSEAEPSDAEPRPTDQAGAASAPESERTSGGDAEPREDDEALSAEDAEVAPHIAPATPRVEGDRAGSDGDAAHATPAEAPSPDAPQPGASKTSSPKTVPLTPVKEKAAAPASPEEGAEADATASQPNTATKPRVILLRLDAANVDASTTKLIQGLFTSAAARQPGIELVTLDDLAKTMDLEAERQALACGDDVADSCLAEIAGAMGARYIAYGQVGRLGPLTLLQLHLFDGDRARSINRVDLKVAEIEELADQMDPAVAELFSPLTGVETEAAGLAMPVGGTLLGLSGLSLLVAAAGGVTFGAGLYRALQSNNRTAYDPAQPAALNTARQFALLGNLGSVIGVAGLLGAAVLAGAGAATMVILE